MQQQRNTATIHTLVTQSQQEQAEQEIRVVTAFSSVLKECVTLLRHDVEPILQEIEKFAEKHQPR
jgi:hypothetical protein